jgi:hypothetical protein
MSLAPSFYESSIYALSSGITTNTWTKWSAALCSDKKLRHCFVLRSACNVEFNTWILCTVLRILCSRYLSIFFSGDSFVTSQSISIFIPKSTCSYAAVFKLWNASWVALIWGFIMNKATYDGLGDSKRNPTQFQVWPYISLSQWAGNELGGLCLR